ncbi:MAG TPA: AAA family ATPase, partial [Stellaceae bacterium]|nr:AAA family ATPase [Stellaceae bacterium]
LPDRRIQTRLHELGMAAALEFINGAQSDIAIVERSYTLDSSRVEVTDIVKEAALAIHGSAKRDCWAVDVDSETCVIRIGQLPQKIEMLIGVRCASHGDPFTAKRSYFSVAIYGVDREKVKALRDALQEKIGKKHLATVTWYFMFGDETRQSSVILDPAPPVYDEFYPWVKGGLRAYFEGFLASSSSLLFLSGPPGTGKTSLIRWLLHEYSMNAAVTYEEKLLSSDSTFVDFLTGDSQNVFVIEDADTILGSRSREGNKMIARFLNVSDGLIKFPHKKVIFTTNLDDFKKVDEALLRPGRCFGMIKCRALSYDEAGAAAKVAGLKVPERKGEYTIAELFNPDTQFDAAEPRRVGF